MEHVNHHLHFVTPEHTLLHFFIKGLRSDADLICYVLLRITAFNDYTLQLVRVYHLFTSFGNVSSYHYLSTFS